MLLNLAATFIQRKLHFFLFILCFCLAIHAVGIGAQPSVSVPTLPSTPYEYANVALPAHFNDAAIVSADNTPITNPITNEGAALGRVLFYDPLLSANDTISCSSCHRQEFGFSDPAPVSTGFAGGTTDRNSMGLANGRYYQNGKFFWDERAATMEAQALMPIEDPIEMGMTLAALEVKLAATSYYPNLFEDAFGDSAITSQRISFALAQFQRSMISYQSKFDAGVLQNFANLTPQENQGRNLFMSNRTRCAQCHETTIQIADRPHNNGLEATTVDAGVADGRFKVPSLRNIEVTAPYMRDGRFFTLEQVVEHYNSGVQAHPQLAPQLRAPGGGPVQPRRLNLNQQEKDALVAFLKTLTDHTFLNDVRFSDPFNVTYSVFLPVLQD